MDADIIPLGFPCPHCGSRNTWIKFWSHSHSAQCYDCKKLILGR